MHVRTHILRALILAALMMLAVAPAYAAPTLPPSAPVSQASITTTDSATRRVIELQQSIDDVQAEQVAIDNRIEVTGKAIVDQTTALDRAQTELRAAQLAYNERAIAMYKFTGLDSLAVLLDASSWNDFVGRAAILSRMLDIDRVTLEEASVVAAQAEFQAGQLEDLRQQDVELRGLREERIRIMQSAVTEQQTLLVGLTPANRLIVDGRKAQTRTARQKWIAASIPLGTRIRSATGRVLPYTDRTYLVSQFHYRTYRTTGVTYRAVCSWYGAAFNGRRTASGQTYNMNDFTCAHKTLPFGTWLALTRYDT
ncbi:MAG: hypothetical protein Q7W30_04715, partial [Coriobacteriia bacterium]|nr:hypothetical protein [Coriobacteriia bacterium]